MSEDLRRVTIRIAKEMAGMHNADPVTKNQTTLAVFMGYGLSLAFCYEQATGNSAKNLKPIEILKWALDLMKSEKRVILQ